MPKEAHTKAAEHHELRESSQGGGRASWQGNP